MTKKVAVLGLDGRGAFWTQAFKSAGWTVSGFDPDASVAFATNRDMRREETISRTVQGANWVVCCVPERLELMQKVIQRAQAEAPKDAVVAVATRSFDIDAVQDCAVRPGQLIVVEEDGAGGFAASITRRNGKDLKQNATETLSEIAAVLSFDEAPFEAHSNLDDAQSA